MTLHKKEESIFSTQESTGSPKHSFLFRITTNLTIIRLVLFLNKKLRTPRVFQSCMIEYTEFIVSKTLDEIINEKNKTEYLSILVLMSKTITLNSLSEILFNNLSRIRYRRLLHVTHNRCVSYEKKWGQTQSNLGLWSKIMDRTRKNFERQRSLVLFYFPYEDYSFVMNRIKEQIINILFKRSQHEIDLIFQSSDEKEMVTRYNQIVDIILPNDVSEKLYKETIEKIRNILEEKLSEFDRDKTEFIYEIMPFCLYKHLILAARVEETINEGIKKVIKEQINRETVMISIALKCGLILNKGQQFGQKMAFTNPDFISALRKKINTLDESDAEIVRGSIPRQFKNTLLLEDI